jgi:hypothetical protein
MEFSEEQAFDLMPVGSFVIANHPTPTEKGVIYRVTKHWEVGTKEKSYNSHNKRREISVEAALDFPRELRGAARQPKRTTKTYTEFSPLDALEICLIRDKVDTVLRELAQIVLNVNP